MRSKTRARDAFAASGDWDASTILDNQAFPGKPAFVMDVAAFKEQLNLFLHRQNIRKLTLAERSLAREWCMDFIRREHAEWSTGQAERFYDDLINVRVTAVDEWTRRQE
jgi:hypothetical protein